VSVVQILLVSGSTRSGSTVKTLAFRALATLRADPNVRWLLTTGDEQPGTTLPRDRHTEGIEHHGTH